MTDDQLVKLIQTVDDWAGRPFTHPSELADELGVSRQAVRYRTEPMVEEGRINKHSPGRVTIYWTDD